jgi:hypothetical protein
VCDASELANRAPGGWTRLQANRLSAESWVHERNPGCMEVIGEIFFSNYSPPTPLIRNKSEWPCSWLHGAFLVARRGVAPRESAARLTCRRRLTKSWRWPNVKGRIERNRATGVLSTVGARGGQVGPRKTFYRRSFRSDYRIHAGPWTEKTD